jgi:enoyl-CoA hydratase
MSTSVANEVLIRRQGRAGCITMNRPQALNALTQAMLGPIWHALLDWQDDSGIELVVLDGSGERALCAGGDVRALYHSRSQGSGAAQAFWREEYRLNALIGRYAKPYVAIQDGIVMGGGIGLSGHARHRVVTERSRLAMPETGIGLIPDVGGTWLLARAPGEVGLYLGLTGAEMDAADALHARFADTFVPAHRLAELRARFIDPMGGPVADVLEAFAQSAGQSRLAERSAEIDRIFANGSVETIVAALERSQLEWSAHTLAALAQKSPKALKLTYAAIRQARRLPCLEAALDVEFRLAVRLFEDGEFPEGVRALIVDKDRKPAWSPPGLADVSDALVQRYLAPLPAAEELGLAVSARRGGDGPLPRTAARRL